MQTLAQRLKHALEITGTKKAELARGINVKPPVIQFLCDSDVQNSKFACEIAAYLGLNLKWLLHGEGVMFASDDPANHITDHYQTVPILTNLELLEKINNIPTNISASASEPWALIRSKNKAFFATHMADTSMEPVLPINTLLFIEKNSNHKIKENDIVLAYVKKSKSLIVRSVITQNKKYFLSPFNLELFNKVECSENILIIGKVFECQWRLHKEA